MFNSTPDSRHGNRGVEKLSILQRENADLRQQLALLMSQSSDRVPFEPAGLFYGEARYRALIELSPQVIWMADAAGNVIYTNRFWHEYSGQSYQQTLGVGAIAIVHPADAEHTVQNWRKALRTGSAYDNEARFRRASDGQYRWHLTRALPLKNGAGDVVRWVGISVDIHDRKIFAAAVAESDERVRIAVEAAGMGTWDYYPDTNETRWSLRSKEIFGLPTDEGMDLQAFLKRVHPDDRERVAAGIREAKDPQVASEYKVEYRVVMPDDRIRWVTARGKCFFSGTGATRKPTRFSGVVLDITEAKQAEQERDRLITVMQNSPYFISVLDLQGNVLFVNRAGRELAGLPEGARQSVIDCLHSEEKGLFVEKILPTIRGGSIWEGETRFVNSATNNPTIVEMRVFGITNESRELVSAAVIGRDISEKKRMEAQLALAQKMDALGKLAGGLAHDFGNLLTIIGGYGEILRNRLQDDSESLRLITQVCSAAMKASSLTSQLMAFGKPQMAQPRLLNLTECVTRVLDMLRPLVGENVVIETHLERDLWNVQIDPAQIDQILINLAANSRDAMPEGGGTISIEIQNCSLGALHAPGHPFVAGDYVKLAFSDTGVGMDAETLKHIFETFFTTKEPGKGTGLGLATVHGIMQQVRGQISVFSEPGRGTTFVLFFPRASEGTDKPPASRETERLRGSETILMVDDDNGVREMLEECLRKAGYSVYTAARAQEALDVAQNHDVDLLITDIVMPGGTGRDLALEAQKIQPGLRTILMSSRVERDTLQEALRQPATSFVAKPFSLKDMLAAVRTALDEIPSSNDTAAQ